MPQAVPVVFSRSREAEEEHLGMLGAKLDPAAVARADPEAQGQREHPEVCQAEEAAAVRAGAAAVETLAPARTRLAAPAARVGTEATEARG